MVEVTQSIVAPHPYAGRVLTLLRPRYWPGHLAMIAAVAIATGLGIWQLDAWHTRRDDARRDLTDKPAVALGSLMTGDSAFPGRSLGRPVSFAGSWVGANTYVSDRDLHGKRGYWVVSALKVDGTDSAMPVVRGWSAKPDVPAPTGATSLVGWLQASEGSGPYDQNGMDDIIPTMRVASLVEKYDIDLYSAYVVEKGGGAGLKALTPASVPPVSSFTALRNLFYALEWWVFAGFAFFVWVRWCRDTLYPPEPEDEPEVES
jgi:surfeit locus 1 family protein